MDKRLVTLQDAPHGPAKEEATSLPVPRKDENKRKVIRETQTQRKCCRGLRQRILVFYQPRAGCAPVLPTDCKITQYERLVTTHRSEAN